MDTGLLGPCAAVQVAIRSRAGSSSRAESSGGRERVQARQPTQVRHRPGALAGVGDAAVAQQQGVQAVARVAALAHRVLARTHQVAHGFVGRLGHAHGREVTRSRQARRHDGVAPVGLDAIARALGDRRRRDDFAAQALRAQVAPDDKATGAGFVHHVPPMTLADQQAMR